MTVKEIIEVLGKNYLLGCEYLDLVCKVLMLIPEDNIKSIELKDDYLECSFIGTYGIETKLAISNDRKTMVIAKPNEKKC